MRKAFAKIDIFWDTLSDQLSVGIFRSFQNPFKYSSCNHGNLDFHFITSVKHEFACFDISLNFLEF